MQRKLTSHKEWRDHKAGDTNLEGERASVFLSLMAACDESPLSSRECMTSGWPTSSSPSPS